MNPTLPPLPTLPTRLSGLRLSTILVCFLMNMLDGMDVMVISYTAPAIAKEWAIKPTDLGLVFSMGLLGMAIGAMFLASQADVIGRRRVRRHIGFLQFPSGC